MVVEVGGGPGALTRALLNVGAMRRCAYLHLSRKTLNTFLLSQTHPTHALSILPCRETPRNCW